MNGLNYNNLMIGMLLAKDLPQQEQLTLGLAASQFPQNNMMGAVLLKPTIDGKVAAEAGKASAESERDKALQALNAAQGEITEAIRRLNEAVPPGNAATLAGAVTNAVDALRAAREARDAALRDLATAKLPTTIDLQALPRDPAGNPDTTVVRLSVTGGTAVNWALKSPADGITFDNTEQSGRVAKLSFVGFAQGGAALPGKAELVAKVDGVEEVVTVTTSTSASQ